MKGAAVGGNDGVNEKPPLKPTPGTNTGAEGTNSFAASLRKGLTGAVAGLSEDAPPGIKTGVLALRLLML